MKFTTWLILNVAILWLMSQPVYSGETVLERPPAYVRQSWERDFRELQTEIKRLTANPPDGDPRHDPDMLDSQALIWPSDRDPFDVELRRFTALIEWQRDAGDKQAIKAAYGAETQLREIRQLAVGCNPETTDGARRRMELYLQAREVRRRLALANPLLDFDEIIFNTGRLLGAHIQTHFRATHSTAPGDLFRLTGFKTDTPQVEMLLHAPRLANGRHQGEPLRRGAFQTLDLSFDGRMLLFEWCARQTPDDLGEDSIFNPRHFALDNTFNIYSLDLETGELRQLTDTRYNDAAPCWLPNGRIAFISDRREIHVRCHPDIATGEGKKQRNLQPCVSLFSTKADGSDLTQLSWHETSEVFPRVTNDGRIVYTRWDYVDREFHAGHSIWFCMPDGRDPRSPHGNYPFPHDCFDFTSPLYMEAHNRFQDTRHWRPWAEYGIRPIPGSEKYIAVASEHHKSAKGELVLIDPRMPDDGAMAQVKCITTNLLPREGARRDEYARGYPYAWPCPLSEDFYLVTHLPSGSLVLLDRFGNRDILFQRTGMLFALPRRARERPPIIPTQTYQGERAGTSGHRPATIAVMNVYESDFVWPAGVKITDLRVVQIFPRPWSSPFQRVGQSYMTGTIPRMPLGTVPVEEDGSAYFEAPVECEIYFQALDENGLAVQSMRSGTYVHPGEQMSCTGCHEDKWKQQRVNNTPLALLRAPSALEPEITGFEPMNFYRHVKPVLDDKCIGCHRTEGVEPSTSDYKSLAPYAFFFHASGGSLQAHHGGYRSGAGHVGARASRMGQALFDEQHKRYLTEDYFSKQDRRCITLWLDLNSLELGSSSIDMEDQSQQRAGEIVWPKLDCDPTNLKRVETFANSN